MKHIRTIVASKFSFLGLIALILAGITPISAAEKDGNTMVFRPIIGLSSTMLESQEGGTYIDDIEDAYNPFNNISGIDVGFSLKHDDHPLILSFKTNRFATIKNIKTGTLYRNDQLVGEVDIERRTTTGTLAITYLHPYVKSFPILPYLSYSRNKAENSINYRGVKGEKTVEEYYWGPGFVVPFNKEFSSGAAFTYILENDDAGTKNGLNISLFMSIHNLRF